MGNKESIFTISQNKDIHFYKKLNYDIRSHYKNIIYYYDLLDSNGDILKTVKHNYINRPTEILYYNNQLKKIEYWVHGKLHRKWGAAIINYNNRKIISEEWYHKGIKLSDQEVKDVIKIIERKRKLSHLMKKYMKK